MKPGHVEDLLRAIRAKKQLEETRAQAIRNAQEKLAGEANALSAEIAPLAEDGRETSGADLSLYARRIAYLERAAAEKREAIKRLDPQRQAHERALRQALREEQAWRKLRDEQRAEALRAAANRSEEAREAVALLKRKAR